MSDPVENVDVEDVLSSIRRLVAEKDQSAKPVVDDATAGEDDAMTREALVLTAAFRVDDPATEPEAHDVDSSTPDMNNLRTVLVGHAAAADGNLDLPKSRLHLSATDQQDAGDGVAVVADIENDKFSWPPAAESDDQGDYYEDEHVALDNAPVEPEQNAQAAEQEVEAIAETADEQIQAESDDWSGVTEDETSGAIDTVSEVREPNWDLQDREESLSDAEAEADDAMRADDDRDDVVDAELVEDAAEPDVAEVTDALSAEDREAAEFVETTPDDYAEDEDQDQEPVSDGEPVQDADESQIAAAAPAGAVMTAADIGGAVIDEDVLRDLVGEIVRQELGGAMGERITRNVRKLVRREVHRALLTKDFD